MLTIDHDTTVLREAREEPVVVLSRPGSTQDAQNARRENSPTREKSGGKGNEKKSEGDGGVKIRDAMEIVECMSKVVQLLKRVRQEAGAKSLNKDERSERVFEVLLIWSRGSQKDLRVSKSERKRRVTDRSSKGRTVQIFG